MKKTIFFVLLLFILAGAAAASEDANITGDLSADTSELIVNDTLQSTQEVELQENESTAENTTQTEPEITAYNVQGTEGKPVTLKADVSGVKENTTVTFTLNGEIYTAKTDASGTASVSVTCPETETAKATSKTSGKIVTDTITYSKTYKGTVSVGDVTKSFTVTSTLPADVYKYKIIKKTKTKTIKLKKGSKTYITPSMYGIITLMQTKKSKVQLGVGIFDLLDDEIIKFKIKEQIKKPGGKAKWTKWHKVKKMFYKKFAKNVKVKKIKVKYTQIDYKLL